MELTGSLMDLTFPLMMMGCAGLAWDVFRRSREDAREARGGKTALQEALRVAAEQLDRKLALAVERLRPLERLGLVLTPRVEALEQVLIPRVETLEQQANETDISLRALDHAVAEVKTAAIQGVTEIRAELAQNHLGPATNTAAGFLNFTPVGGR